MAEYMSTPCDLEAGAEKRTVVLVERSPSGGGGRAGGCMWKALGALFVVGLCFGGVLLFAWCWNGRTEMTAELGHTEAQTKKDTDEKTNPHKTVQELSSKSKAAIHLEGDYDEDKDHMVVWRKDQGQAFAQGGFELQSNKIIIIPDTGLYFVYSQASFRVPCGEGAQQPFSTPLSHRIWRFSESLGGEASLMSAVRSACQNTAQKDGSGHGWYNAIYLGAVFQLNKGDKLWTETNQLAGLETDDGKTFFGVFAL
ncbi:tumor necrosis factor b (TNF superfamily, member 2) [Mugil cephalus]|uniref:tumor necrosis factor b (TNF superfamily, member 2) n=1 Tax=Mugil cephalus TaxID=48193 RepID=UPI001FB583E2|nr:tumor necrosis factor b (TNF superfamily, member 2) [Mugil cephalus]